MSGPPPSANIPGGLSISGAPSGNTIKDDDQDDDHHDDTSVTHGGRPAAGDKRRRRGSSTSGPTSASSNTRGATSPHSPNSVIPPPLNIPAGNQPPGSQQSHPSHQQANPQIALGSPTSPQQQHQQVPPSSTPQYSPGSYHHPGQQQQQHHQPQQHDNMYSPHMMSPSGYSYPGPGGPPAPGGAAQQLGGLAAAAAQHTHWASQQPQVGQGGHYGRR